MKTKNGSKFKKLRLMIMSKFLIDQTSIKFYKRKRMLLFRFMVEKLNLEKNKYALKNAEMDNVALFYLLAKSNLSRENEEKNMIISKLKHKSCCLANSRDKLVLNLHKSQNRENDLKNLLTKYKNRKNGWAKIKRKTFSSIFD
ncbi:hypothetical protein MHBO_001288, partial [Bonamia ostreae]